MGRNVSLGASFAALRNDGWKRADGASNWTHSLAMAGGSGTATVIVEGTMDPDNEAGAVQPIVTLSANGATPDSAPGLIHTWAYVRARCTAISNGAQANYGASGV